MQICLLEAEKRTQDMIRIIGRGAPHGKGGTSLPTSAAVGRVIGENGKSWLFFWYCYNFIYLCAVIINFKVITLW